MVFSFHQFKIEEVWDRILLCGVNVNQLLIIEVIISFIIAFCNVMQILLLNFIFRDYVQIDDYTGIIMIVICTTIVGCMNGLIVATFIDNSFALLSVSFSISIIYSIAGGAVL